MNEAAGGGAPVIEVFRRRPPQELDFDLTPDEMRILKLLGENYKTAAAIVGVTTHAISFHVRRIYEKLHVHSRTEAVAKALRSGLFD